MELTKIIQDAAARMSSVTVELDHSYGTVTISDDEGVQDDIFMQGDDANLFLNEVDDLYQKAGDVTEDECALCAAESYVECLWN